MKFYIKYLAPVIILINLDIYAQENGNIKLKLIEKENKSPVTEANVKITNTVYSSITDKDGVVTFTNLKPGMYTIEASRLGYKPEKLNYVEVVSAKTAEIVLEMKESIITLEDVVVTAGKTEQAAKDIANSVSVIDAVKISNTNSSRLDEALNYVSGINFSLSQISIRGSSGFSLGVGSRVLVLLDGIPILTGDTGGMTWENIALNQIEKIEIIKGSGSALYGSNALGGIINVITKKPTSELNFYFKVYGSIYDKPSFSQWEWSDKLRTYSGVNLNVSKRTGRFSINALMSKTQSDGYKEQDWYKRLNLFLKIKYDFSKKLSLLNSSTLYLGERGNFFYWESLQNALRVNQNSLGQVVKTQSFNSNINLKYLLNTKTDFNFKLNWYYYKFKDNITGTFTESVSNVYQTEEQITHKFSKNNQATAGVVFGLNTVKSELFGNRKSYVSALYVQDNFKISKDFKLSLGARFDYFKIDTLQSDFKNNSQLNPKIGLIYEYLPAANFRLSFSTAFRAPSISEVFTTTSASGITIGPNPNLKPEKSISYEIGILHAFSNKLFMDVALFRNEYKNLIEPVPSGQVYIFDNIAKASIQGFEAGLSSRILKFLSISAGYTFIDAKEKLPDGTSIELKYRPKHLLKSNLLASYKNFQFIVDFRYNSKIQKIDKTLMIQIPNAEAMVDVYILDLKVSYNWLYYRFSIGVNNLLRYNYTEFVGNLGPIRNFYFSIEGFF